MLLQIQTENFQNYTCVCFGLSYEMQMSLAFHIHHGKQQTPPFPCSAMDHTTVYSGSFSAYCPSFFSTESNISLTLYVEQWS